MIARNSPYRFVASDRRQRPGYGQSVNPGGWVKVMKGAIGKNAAYFNSHRVMRRYATEAYMR